MAEETVIVQLKQERDFQFSIAFGASVPPLLGDEPPPLGQGAGPSPVQLLAASVGNCLTDSLLFALRKYKQAPEPLGCTVTAEVGRNSEGRLRVLQLQADLTLGVAAATLDHLERALSQFEAFCTVTQSVASAIPVEVRVFDADGTRMK